MKTRAPLRPISLWTLAFTFAVSLLAGSSAQAQTYTILHTFVGGSDGSQPEYWLVPDGSGNLYGTTIGGGCSNCTGYGTLYKITITGNETVLHAFPASSTDGEQPNSPVALDSKGNIYGTTQNGGNPANGCAPPPGATGCGTVYKVSSGNTETIVYNFSPDSPIQFPRGSFVLSGGRMYSAAIGPNQSNGSEGNGVLFELTGSGTLTTLYQFTGGDNGAWPFQGLVRDSAGNFYGTTNEGGTGGVGTIFKISGGGVQTILHNFTGPDGAYPSGPLLLDSSGNLYGLTSEGGSSKVGVLFELQANGTLTVLHNFVGGSLGAYPGGNLARDTAGNFYGAAGKGGTSGDGTIFEISASGTETTLHTFTGSPDGVTPTGVLVLNGSLYGTTSAGGDSTCQCGLVFKIAE